MLFILWIILLGLFWLMSIILARGISVPNYGKCAIRNGIGGTGGTEGASEE